MKPVGSPKNKESPGSTEKSCSVFLFQKKIRIHNNFSSTQNQQQIPSEQMATDCFKFARRPFWNHFESGYCFGPKPSFWTAHIKKWVASMLIESQTKWLWKWNTSICSTSYLYIQRFVIAHLYFCCCAACAYIFLLVIIWAASATGRWLWQRGRSIGPLCMYACLPSSLFTCVYTATNENALSASFEIPGARCWRRFQHWHRRWRSWPYDQL